MVHLLHGKFFVGKRHKYIMEICFVAFVIFTLISVKFIFLITLFTRVRDEMHVHIQWSPVKWLELAFKFCWVDTYSCDAHPPPVFIPFFLFLLFFSVFVRPEVATPERNFD
eukprot:Rmarinus@m.15369